MQGPCRSAPRHTIDGDRAPVVGAAALVLKLGAAMLRMIAMRYRFDRFELDTERFALARSGRALAVEPKVFDLLAHFVANPGRVCSIDDLVCEVWHGRVVSDTTVATCIKNARKALGDSGDAQRLIKTVRGRGYAFEAVVQVDAGPQAPLPQTPAYRAPSLLLMPLRADGGDAAAVRLGEAVRDEVAAILGRIPLLRIAVHAPWQQQAIAPAARALHEQLGADFLLDGSLHSAGDGFRLSMQLVDARSGFQCWSSRFALAGPLDHALSEAPVAVVARLEPHLVRAIHDSVRASSGESSAQRLFLEAYGVLGLKGWQREGFAEAADLLRRSAQADPGFALTPAFLALVCGLGQRIGLIGSRDEAIAEAEAAASLAMRLDPLDPTVLGYAGCSLADIGQAERALPILRQAVELDAANAQAWAALGSACMLAGDLEQGVHHLAHGIEISPLDSRLSFWGTFLAMGLLALGRVDEARGQAELACQRDARCAFARLAQAAIRLSCGDAHGAGAAVHEAFRLDPALSPEQIASVTGRRAAAALLALRPT